MSQPDINKWWPSGNNSIVIERRHVSDMYLLQDFLRVTGAQHIRLLCRPPPGPDTARLKQCKVIKFVITIRYHPLVFVDRCKHLGTLLRAFHFMSINGIIQPMFQGLPVPALHFQGGCKPMIPWLLCPSLLQSRTVSKHLERMCQLPIPRQP
jgi:hypothetical protein